MNNNFHNNHQNQPVLLMGSSLSEATSAMILLHGRGADAESILPLADFFTKEGMAYLAPQAGLNRWYPMPFMAALEMNQPDLDFALARVHDLVQEIHQYGLPYHQIWLAGFSQGACLAAEFAGRFPKRYGGLLIFSGGRIGPPGIQWSSVKPYQAMPVFLGCSNIDAHIPESRVHETAAFFETNGAQVVTKIYPNMGHTITNEEIEDALQLFSQGQNFNPD